MLRGTLMVLKRLLITALGALSLGALAAGPASAQDGQIPAPDAYGDPQACAANIKVMKAAADKGEVQDNGLTPMQKAALLKMARSCAGDVGGGIAEARKLYNAAVDTEAELKAAGKAYADDDSARNLEKRDEAQEAHDEAVAARNDYSGGGAIYESVFVEEDSLAKAKAASSAFTKAEVAAAASEMLRDTVELDDYINAFAGFDETGQAYEFVTVRVKTAETGGGEDRDEPLYETRLQVKKQGGATVGPVRSNPKEDTSALIAPTDLTITEGSTTVVFESVLVDHDLDDTTADILIVTNDVRGESTIGMVNRDYMTAKMALETATKAVTDNQRPTQVPILEEAKNVAQARYDFFAAQKARVEKSLAAGDLVVDRMGDNPTTVNMVETDHPLDDTPYTVEDYEALTDLQDAETDAAEALKAAYDARVAATNDVEENQRNTGAYLDQLVALRQNQKAAADAAAIKAEAEEETAGQKEANENLAAANAQLKSFTDLQALDDANPVKALVNSLVAAEDSAEDDDGQALVDAVSATYDTAKAAQTTADAAMGALTAEDDPDTEEDEAGPVTANTDAIAGLTAVDDPATEADESGAVTANTDAIAGLTAVDDPATEADESGAVTANTDAIAGLTAVDDPATEADESGAVTANTDAIAGLTAVDDPATEADESGAVTANTDRSTSNAGAIAGLTAEDDPDTEADESGAVTANTDRSTSNAGAIAGLTAEDDPDTEADESGAVTANTGDIVTLDGRVTVNEDAIDDHDMKLMAKKMYIDAIGAEMGFDPATGMGTEGDGMSRIDNNEAAIGANSSAIVAETAARTEADTAEASAREAADTAEASAREAADTAEASAREAADTAEASAREAADTAEASAREMADTMLGGRIDTNVTNIAANSTAITAEQTARMEYDTMLGGRIDVEEMARMAGDAANAADIATNSGGISANTGLIADNMAAISGNSSMINDNRNMIGANSARIDKLSDDLDIVRSGVAASMALAGMPNINGRGIAIGVGSFDGESAFAVGFQIQGEMASFQIGVTSSGGETGASAGVGFQF